jgi:hypothetical protein
LTWFGVFYYYFWSVWLLKILRKKPIIEINWARSFHWEKLFFETPWKILNVLSIFSPDNSHFFIWHTNYISKTYLIFWCCYFILVLFSVKYMDLQYFKVKTCMGIHYLKKLKVNGKNWFKIVWFSLSYSNVLLCKVGYARIMGRAYSSFSALWHMLCLPFVCPKAYLSHVMKRRTVCMLAKMVASLSCYFFARKLT